VSKRLAAGLPRLTPDDWVFSRDDGTHLDPGYVTKRFGALCRQASVPEIRLHDLRHTSASLGLAAGESLKEISARLGHSSITVTADIYTHVTPTLARTSAENLASLVEESGVGSA
jgi:integrase